MGRIGTQVYSLLVDLVDSAAQSTTLAHSLAQPLCLPSYPHLSRGQIPSLPHSFPPCVSARARAVGRDSASGRIVKRERAVS